MAIAADDRAKAVELALSQIEKQFGKGSIVRLGSKEALVPIAVISTGSISFDAALGVGGIPRGRVSEVFGPESSGKTTICLQIIAEAQKAGAHAGNLVRDLAKLTGGGGGGGPAFATAGGRQAEKAGEALMAATSIVSSMLG